MIVPKGYIAVDGISLTVVAVNAGSALSFTAEGAGWFSVMLIAYTQAHVTLPRKRVGERVNLEVDVVGACRVYAVGTWRSRISRSPLMQEST
jgi:riboflavin synthase